MPGNYHRRWRDYLRTVLSRIKPSFTRRRQAHLRRGRMGEKLARRLLKSLGLDILITNYHGPRGEIDIIARDGRLLCFIEVKTRGYRLRSRPADAVTRKKKARIISTARHYLRLLNDPPVAYRFDVVEVVYHGLTPKEIRYWPNEFTSDDIH